MALDGFNGSDLGFPREDSKRLCAKERASLGFWKSSPSSPSSEISRARARAGFCALGFVERLGLESIFNGEDTGEGEGRGELTVCESIRNCYRREEEDEGFFTKKSLSITIFVT